MTDHVDELSELYALGVLDEAERLRVERHAATCDVCAERLHEAERTVADIAQGQPQFEPSSALARRLHESIKPPRAQRPFHLGMFGLAFAAALAIAFIPTWLAVDRTRAVSQAMAQDERALARIAGARTFNRAEFMSPQNEPMNAKVLYSPYGDWYYVVVMHPRPGMQVAYVHDHHMEKLGTVAMHGESGTLYLPVNHKMNELALLQGDTVVADAHLVY